MLLSTSEQEWRNEPIGMTGSYYSLATALPELDGVIEPIAIGTKEENPDGLVVRAPLSERIDALVERASGWLELRRKPNAEKKAAIFYYKGPGAAAFVAQSLEVADSLYNLLTRMRGEGYDLGGDFPETVEAFKTRLEKEGRTVGQWELGAYDKFLRECNPEFIPEHTYQRWFDAYLSEQARNAITDAWGLPPGGFMTRDLPDDYGLIVPRVRFGNVVLIPQPTTDVLLSDPYSKQGDELDAVHGTGKAPPHFYVAAYLWAQFEVSEKIQKNRMETWRAYRDAFEPRKDKWGIELQAIPEGCTHNAHMFYIKCRNLEQRSRFISFMKISERVAAKQAELDGEDAE